MILIQPQYLPALAQSRLLRRRLGADPKRSEGALAPARRALLQRPSWVAFAARISTWTMTSRALSR